MINEQYRNSITSVKTYPGADIGSDHTPLVSTIRFKMKKVKNRKTAKDDLRQLKNEGTKQKVQQYMKSQISQIQKKESKIGRN